MAAKQAKFPSNQVLALYTALMQCYELSDQEAQNLSSLAYGKFQILDFLAKCQDDIKHIGYRILFFLLQSSITVSDYISHNIAFVDQLIEESLINGLYSKETQRPRYKLVNKEELVGFQALYSFGTFFNFDIQLDEGAEVVSPITDAASSLLALVCRLSLPVRRQLLKDKLDKFLDYIRHFQVPEVLQPFRLFNILSIYYGLITLQMDKQVFNYLLQTQHLEDALNDLCKVVFLNNSEIFANINNLTQGSSKFLKSDYSQVYNANNGLIFKSDEIFQMKVQLIALILKLREAK